MRYLSATTLLFVLFLCTCAKPPSDNQQQVIQQRQPIIDVHAHAVPADFMSEPGIVLPWTGKPAIATTDEAVMQETLAAMRRYNIVKAVLSGPLEHVYKWIETDPERFIGAPMFPFWGPWPDLAQLREDYLSGRLGALGEITAIYAGLSPSDPQFEPYLALAEELDIPVGIHAATIAPPGSPLEGYCDSIKFGRYAPKFRIRFGNPELFEEMLVRHPKLRVYLMHAGYPHLEETIALMFMYPHVYAGLGAINWGAPREEFHYYLRRLLQAGLGKRLMFGSDAASYPELYAIAIEAIESAGFLTGEQKRDIFYNNAARVLRLEEEAQ